MQLCPMCGFGGYVTIPSQMRGGVYICSSCTDYEVVKGRDPWWVDKLSVSKLAKDFIEARDIYLNPTLSYFSQGVAMYQEEYQRLLPQLLGTHIIVKGNGRKLSMVLGDFTDPNLAIARTVGILPSTAVLTGSHQWSLDGIHTLYILSVG